MKISLNELVEKVGAIKVSDHNDHILIENLAPIEKADGRSVSFLHHQKYYPWLYKTKAAVVLVPEDFVPENGQHPVLVYVKDVYSKLIELLNHFKQNGEVKTGIEEPSFIASDVQMGKDVYVGAFAYVAQGVSIGNHVKIYPNTYIGENCSIGDHTVIYPGATIYRDTLIGKNCILHAGCVLGSDGFGHAKQADGSYEKIPQIGQVIVGNNVEIGANTTVDRATIEATIIEEGVKLDNLIQIAHNVEIGENTVISSQAGISGSTKIGKRCMIGGQVGFANHLDIADGSIFGAQSGVAQSIQDENKVWFGTPVLPLRETLRLYNIQKKLPDLVNRINQLEKKVKELKPNDK